MECYFAPEEPAWIIPAFRRLHKYHMDALETPEPEENGFSSRWRLVKTKGRFVYVKGAVFLHGDVLARYAYRMHRRDVTKSQQIYPLNALDVE